MKVKNYDVQLSQKVYDYYINNEIGHNKMCIHCKQFALKRGQLLKNGPIPAFHIGEDYQKSKIKLLFLGTVAYGWERLNETFFNLSKPDRIKNKLDTIDLIEKEVEALFFGNRKTMKFFTYIRESSNYIFDNNGFSKIIITNLLKCNSGIIRNHYPQKVFDYCIRKEFNGNLLSDIEILKPTHIVLLSSDYRKYGRYMEIIKDLEINILMLPHPSSSQKGNTINIWKEKIKEFVERK